jgi:hypothetical protein
MRGQYDRRIQDLDNQLKLADGEQNEHVVRIKDLEDKLAKTISGSDEQATNGIPARDIKLRRQILELERLTDEQSVRIEMILQEKGNLEKQWFTRIQEKDDLIDSYEAKIVELQTAFKDKIFAVDEFKNLDEVLRLKEDLEKAQGELVSLRNRYDVPLLKRKFRNSPTLL